MRDYKYDHLLSAHLEKCAGLGSMALRGAAWAGGKVAPYLPGFMGSMSGNPLVQFGSSFLPGGHALHTAQNLGRIASTVNKPSPPSIFGWSPGAHTG